MNVLLLPFDNNAVINKLYVACRTCYSKEGPISIWNEIKDKNAEEDLEKRIKLIKQVCDSGHTSTMEHVQFTFLIEGVSRQLTHQLVRHRIGTAFSQMSQRYCAMDGKLEAVIPESIASNPEMNELALTTLQTLEDVYHTMLSGGIKAEDARCVLPNAAATNLTMSVNLRELMHICEERLCTCAQAEIRSLVNIMAFAIKKELPFLDKYLGPKCEKLMYCPESEKRSCGRKPVKSKVFKEKR